MMPLSIRVLNWSVIFAFVLLGFVFPDISLPLLGGFFEALRHSGLLAVIELSLTCGVLIVLAAVKAPSILYRWRRSTVHLVWSYLVLVSTLSAMFMLVMPAQAQPNTPPETKRHFPQEGAVKNLIVFDANGKKVAYVFDIVDFSVPLILFVVKGFLPFSLLVHPDRILGRNALVFKSSDCSGTPFMQPHLSPKEVLPIVATGSPGDTVYIPDPNSTPQTTSFSSYLQEDFSRSCRTSSEQVRLVPALPLIDLLTLRG